MKTLRLLLWVPLVCAAALVAQSPPPARLFQDAIHLMETRGDYPAALRLFEQVAKGSDRNLAARSLLYAGLCYEKLGKREARNAYERLIRDFGDQTELITAARARLAALNPAGGSPASRGMAAQRVLEDFPAFGDLDAGREAAPFHERPHRDLRDLGSFGRGREPPGSARAAPGRHGEDLARATESGVRAKQSLDTRAVPEPLKRVLS